MTHRRCAEAELVRQRCESLGPWRTRFPYRAGGGTNAGTTRAAIKAAIRNLCRCGIYPRLVEAIQRAARAARGEETIPAGARPGIDPADAARVVPALVPPPAR